MSKYFRSEYLFMLILLGVLSAVTITFLKFGGKGDVSTITSGFYLSCVAPILAAFKSKIEKDKINSENKKPL